MTEYTLPFTCKQRDKFFIILKWVALIIFPIMLIYSILTHQIPTSDTENLWVHPFFSWGIIVSSVGWICQIIFWVAYLDVNDKLPSFKCKCDEQKKSGDVAKE